MLKSVCVGLFTCALHVMAIHSYTHWIMMNTFGNWMSKNFGIITEVVVLSLTERNMAYIILCITWCMYHMMHRWWRNMAIPRPIITGRHQYQCVGRSLYRMTTCKCECVALCSHLSVFCWHYYIHCYSMYTAIYALPHCCGSVWELVIAIYQLFRG